MANKLAINKEMYAWAIKESKLDFNEPIIGKYIAILRNSCLFKLSEHEIIQNRTLKSE